MHGFYAMAAGTVARPDAAIAADAGRLEKGPAFDNAPAPDARGEDWPSYRADARRSGTTKTRIPRDLAQVWRVKCDDKITPPIFVRDRVYLAAPESHSVVCLHASDGKLQWRFTAGGRIDTPPTYHKGTLLFGAADGWLYAIDASSGKLRWRFRCAPVDVRIGAFDQLASVWRLHGSVLVHNGVAYAAAGRSSLLDAGIYTFVIGFGDGISTSQLNAIAAAGGTEFDEFLPADNQTELENAITQIATTLVACDYNVGTPDPSADSGDVNFYIDGTPIPYDENCDSGIGWTWLNLEHTLVRFCDQSCEMFQDGEEHDISVEWGCPPVVPPV